MGNRLRKTLVFLRLRRKRFYEYDFGAQFHAGLKEGIEYGESQPTLEEQLRQKEHDD